MWKSVGAGLFFLFGLDNFPVFFGSAVYLSGAIACDENSPSCPNRAVTLTSGLCVMNLCVWTMPAMLHSWFGYTRRGYHMMAGIAIPVIFAFTSETGNMIPTISVCSVTPVY